MVEGGAKYQSRPCSARPSNIPGKFCIQVHRNGLHPPQGSVEEQGGEPVPHQDYVQQEHIGKATELIGFGPGHTAPSPRDWLREFITTSSRTFALSDERNQRLGAFLGVKYLLHETRSLNNQGTLVEGTLSRSGGRPGS